MAIATNLNTVSAPKATTTLNTQQDNPWSPRVNHAGENNTMMDWYVVNTKSHQERQAEVNLVRLGVEVFCPRLMESKVIRRVRKTVITSLFPGYLFARLDVGTQYRSVIYATGVRKIVTFGATAAKVDQELIDGIRSRLLNGYAMLPSRLPKPGQLVRIQSGPLSGLDAIFEREMTGSQRVVLLLQMLSCQARVVLPAEQVVNL
jgi:transcriptional antiterminator RfaH